MGLIYDTFHHGGPGVRFFAYHRRWFGIMELFANGIFQGGGAKPNGQWHLGANGVLFLDWFSWPPQSLPAEGETFLNEDLTLIPVRAEDLLGLSR